MAGVVFEFDGWAEDVFVGDFVLDVPVAPAGR